MSGAAQYLNIFFVVLPDAGYALLVGALLAGRWLDASAALGTLRRFRLACVAALILADIVRPWFVAASMSGSSRFMATLALVPTVLFSTRQGKLWFANSAVLLALLAAAVISPRLAKPAGVVLLCLLAALKAASGHAADAGDFTLAEFSQFLHIMATAVWAGAVVVSGLLVVPRLGQLGEPSGLWSYGKRLSRVVTWALAALLASGVYNADREMNGVLRALWISGWGRILLAKVALVLIAVSLGAASRFGCLNREATRIRAARLEAFMRTEAVAMILILCFSGVLANTAPPMTGMG